MVTVVVVGGGVTVTVVGGWVCVAVVVAITVSPVEQAVQDGISNAIASTERIATAIVIFLNIVFTTLY